MKNIYAVLAILALVPNLLAQDLKPVKSAEFTIETVKLPAGQIDSIRKITLDGIKVRVEEYKGTNVTDIILADGSTGYIYYPATRTATPFYGVFELAKPQCKFLTVDTLKSVVGDSARLLEPEKLRGKLYDKYSYQGQTAWFESESKQVLQVVGKQEQWMYSGLHINGKIDPSVFKLPADAVIGAVLGTPPSGNSKPNPNQRF